MLLVGSFVWIVCAVVTAIIASSRNRNPFAWGLIGLVIGVFGLILVIALPGVPASKVVSNYHPLVGAGRKRDPGAVQCPDCREDVSITARSCEHCGARLA